MIALLCALILQVTLAAPALSKLTDLRIYHLPQAFTTVKRQFFRFLGACRGGCGVVGAVAKSSEKALVKPFCEKNFTEILARVEKLVGVFLSSPTKQSFFLPFCRIDRLYQHYPDLRTTVFNIRWLIYYL